MKIQTEHVYGGYYVAELDEPKAQEAPAGWGHNWYPEIDAWCEKTFGDQDLWGENPVNGWKRMRNRYFFTEEKSRTLFVIKWS